MFDLEIHIPEKCPFVIGIKECKQALCIYNILGGCFKKGSGYYMENEHKYDDNDESELYNYCPECGQKMDEVKENDI